LFINEQKDIGEFLTNFLERLQEGLGENKKLIRKMMDEDLLKLVQEREEKGPSSLES